MHFLLVLFPPRTKMLWFDFRFCSAHETQDELTWRTLWLLNFVVMISFSSTRKDWKKNWRLQSQKTPLDSRWQTMEMDARLLRGLGKALSLTRTKKSKWARIKNLYLYLHLCMYDDCLIFFSDWWPHWKYWWYKHGWLGIQGSGELFEGSIRWHKIYYACCRAT